MQLAPHVRVRPEKFGALIFDKERERFFVVNEVGKDILELLNRAAPIEEIVDGLSQVYGESPEIIRRDLFAFIDGLREAGLLAE